MPLQGPEFLFQITEGDAVFAPAPQPLPEWVPTLLFFAPALACLVWYVFWWRSNPGAVQVAHLRRVRAVRGALDRLLRLHRESPVEVAGQVARIVREYLRERWVMAASATTPTEIAAALHLALPSELIEQVAAFSAPATPPISAQCVRRRYADRRSRNSFKLGRARLKPNHAAET